MRIGLGAASPCQVNDGEGFLGTTCSEKNVVAVDTSGDCNDWDAIQQMLGRHFFPDFTNEGIATCLNSLPRFKPFKL